MIKRSRARMIPGGVGYSDAPTFGGFSSKSPCSDHAMELADLEAAFVGNLARYCMAMGTVPPFTLKGLWFVNGECKGLGVVDWDTDVEPIIPLIQHLQHYAPFIIGTEGVDDILRAGEDTRWYSEKLFPNETEEWVSEQQAQSITGRAGRTLRRWRENGWVKCINDDKGTLYQKEGLLTVIAAMDGKRSANLPNGQPILQC